MSTEHGGPDPDELDATEDAADALGEPRADEQEQQDLADAREAADPDGFESDEGLDDVQLDAKYAPPSDAEQGEFAARVLAASQIVGHEAARPDLPLRDGFGYEWVELRCFKCGRTHHMVEDAYVLYRARGAQPRCLPCQSPDLFRWRRDDQGREYIQPLEGALKKRVGEVEAATLDRLGYERVEKLDRREFLRELKERVDGELAQVDLRLAALDVEIPAAQDALERAMNDPDRELKQQIADLERQIQKSQQRHEVLKTRARRERSAR